MTHKKEMICKLLTMALAISINVVMCTVYIYHSHKDISFVTLHYLHVDSCPGCLAARATGLVRSPQSENVGAVLGHHVVPLA